MELTDEQITKNKEEFISLLSKVNRKGANIEALIEKLKTSDFFVAPASSKYHCSYKGGLCQHSLNVYNELVKLVKLYYEDYQTIDEYNEKCRQYKELIEKGEQAEEPKKCKIEEDSVILVALLHDMSKIGQYEQYAKNVKVYSKFGSKRDELGNFEWEAQSAYKLKEAEDRFVFSSHGVNSYYMVSMYIQLTYQEALAITNHMGGMDCKQENFEIGNAFNKSTLALLTHMADMSATFLIEPNQYKEETNE